MWYNPHVVEIFVDGSAVKNPGGPCGIGVWSEEHGLGHAGLSVNDTTSNQAEVSAMIWALQWVLENRNDRDVTIITDSQLLQKWAGGRLPKKGSLMTFVRVKELHELIRKFNVVHVRWVPREMNTVADTLSKLGHERA